MEENASQWHLSKYNLFAKIPNKDLIGCVNLLKATYSLLTFEEVQQLYALQPNEKFVKLGFLVGYDEVEAFKTIEKSKCNLVNSIGLTICPTLNCNFDCPYCFEKHRKGKMSKETQDEVVKFANKMINYYKSNQLSITWFGGEPLLEPGIIKSLSEKLIDLANKKQIKYSASIVTNGYLLTQEIVDMLAENRVFQYQITLDGFEEVHDKTRHLVGGQPTFYKIIENLNTLKIKGRINIRYNTYAENLEQFIFIKKFVLNLARESGNNITTYPALISKNDNIYERDKNFELLNNFTFANTLNKDNFYNIQPFKTSYCGAQNFTFITIDEIGRLYKCWEDVDKNEHSFSSLAMWNPANPLGTSDNIEPLVKYINSINIFDDEECKECVWMPFCNGGCPNKRLYGERICTPYKEHPEEFVLNYIDYRNSKRKRNNNTNNTC